MSGGQKTRASMIARFGSEEAYREYMRNLAKKGGAAPHDSYTFKVGDPHTKAMSRKAVLKRGENHNGV